MDDVNFGCWWKSDKIKRFMLARNYSTMEEIEEYYSERVEQMAKDFGLDRIVWQDLIDHGINVRIYSPQESF